jgi:transcriptional regulator with XRE-family HTH domain
MSQDLDFIDRLKTLIEEFPSLSAFARSCGIAESTIRKWRDGDSEPDRDKLVALAEAANVSLEWLVAGKGEMRLGGL